MLHSKLSKLAVFAAVCLLGVGASRAAFAGSTYTFTTIDVPVPNIPYSEAIGISNNGQIVGIGVSGSQGFLDTNGVITPIGSIGQYPGFINNNGQIVGDSASGIYIYSKGSVSYINVPGANNGEIPTGLNDFGQITGWFEPDVNNTISGGYGFMDRSGVFTIISPRAGGYIFINGINNTGQVVGYDFEGEFIYSNGMFTDINLPGIPSGIDDTGQIIGYFGAPYRGFLYDNGVVTTIDFPGAFETVLDGINDAGQIVGWYSDSTGGHDFLATPTADVPEPSTWAMMLLGFAGLGFAGSRRAKRPARPPAVI